MNYNPIRNLATPENDGEGANKKNVDDVTKAVKSNVKDEFRHLIAAHANYYGDLIKGAYQFTFSGVSVSSKHNVFNGFLMPWGGYIKHFVLEDTGFKFSTNKYTNLTDFLRSLDNAQIPTFTLVVIKTTREVVDLGTLFMHFTFFW